MIAASLSMTVPGPVLANEFEPETNGQREVTGMIVFRIPFGGPRRHKRAPEVGFNLTIADPKLRDYKQRRPVRCELSFDCSEPLPDQPAVGAGR